MALTDPIGDMLTRIRNAQMRRREVVSTPASTLRGRVLDVLKSEGFIRGYTESKLENGHAGFDIELKYSEEIPVIRTIERVSRPGRRVYASVKNIPSFANGLGVSILSTPKGVMADHEARSQNLGGEVLCRVF
jgi:small subunit ribosomal protein S8